MGNWLILWPGKKSSSLTEFFELLLDVSFKKKRFYPVQNIGYITVVLRKGINHTKPNAITIFHSQGWLWGGVCFSAPCLTHFLPPRRNCLSLRQPQCNHLHQASEACDSFITLSLCSPRGSITLLLFYESVPLLEGSRIEDKMLINLIKPK